MNEPTTPRALASQRPRGIRYLNIGLFGAFLICCAAWFLSCFWQFQIDWERSRIQLYRGTISDYRYVVLSSTHSETTIPPNTTVLRDPNGGISFVLNFQPGWAVMRNQPVSISFAQVFGLKLPAHSRRVLEGISAKGVTRILWQVTVIPLWILSLISGGGAAFFWRRRRQVLLIDRCKGCGYDLTGNESGTCSECGAKIPKGLSNSVK